MGGGRGGTYSLRGPRGPGKPTIGPMAPAAAAATAAGTSHGVTMRRGESRPRPAPTLGLSQTRSWAGVPAAGQMCQAPPGHGDGCRNGRAGGKRRGAARPAPATEDLTPPPPMAPPTPARPANLSGTRGKWGGGWAARGRRCVCTDGKDFITGTLRAYIASVVYQGYGHQARSEAQQALYSAAAGGGLACEALGPRLAGVAVIGGGALPVEVVGVHLLLPPARHTQNRISQ